MTNELDFEEGEVDDFTDDENVNSPKILVVKEKKKRDSNLLVNGTSEHQTKPHTKHEQKKLKKKALDPKCGNLKLQKCKYFMEGRCSKGNECSFSHDFKPPKRPELCRYYVTGNCGKGDLCVYYHETFPCRYFHTGVCKHGDNCRFSHEPLTPDSKEMLDRSIQEQSTNEENEASSYDESQKDNSNNMTSARMPAITTPLPLCGGLPPQRMFGSLPSFRPPPPQPGPGMWNTPAGGRPPPFIPMNSQHNGLPPPGLPMNPRQMIHQQPMPGHAFMRERMPLRMGPPHGHMMNNYSDDIDYRPMPPHPAMVHQRYSKSFGQRPLHPVTPMSNNSSNINPHMHPFNSSHHLRAKHHPRLTNVPAPTSGIHSMQSVTVGPPPGIDKEHDKNFLDDEIGKLAAIITSKPSVNNDEKKTEASSAINGTSSTANDPRLSKTPQSTNEVTNPAVNPSIKPKDNKVKDNVYGGLIKREVIWQLVELDLTDFAVFQCPTSLANDPRSKNSVNILLAATAVKHKTSFTDSETDTSTEKVVQEEEDDIMKANPVIVPKSNESRRPFRIQLNQMASTVIDTTATVAKTQSQDRSYLSDGRFKRRKITPIKSSQEATYGEEEKSLITTRETTSGT